MMGVGCWVLNFGLMFDVQITVKPCLCGDISNKLQTQSPAPTSPHDNLSISSFLFTPHMKEIYAGR